jgi:SAM-dependent methyltransferase
MIERLKNSFKKQQFEPGLLGVFVNPFYIARRGLWREISRQAPRLSGRLLDVGCGHKPYQRLFTAATGYVGMEFDSPETRSKKRADVYYDGLHFPFPDASFDSALLTQVLEHVFNPDVFLSELSRVMRPGSMILVTAPFAWDEHEQPHDFARYSSFGVRHVLEKAGFEVVEGRKASANLAAQFQLICCYIHKKLSRIRSYRLKLCLYILLIAPITIKGLFWGWLLPDNADFYLDNIILARKR